MMIIMRTIMMALFSYDSECKQRQLLHGNADDDDDYDDGGGGGGIIF